MIVISGCLCGLSCRFDGGSRPDPALRELVGSNRAIAVCPEELGGLGTPRAPSEIVGGDGHDVLAGRARVVNIEGVDVTEAFVEGAQRALEMAREADASHAVFKDGSPSCGVTRIRDGSFSDRRRAGVGVTTALFLEHGLQVVSDEAWEKHRDGLDGRFGLS